MLTDQVGGHSNFACLASMDFFLRSTLFKGGNCQSSGWKRIKINAQFPRVNLKYNFIVSAFSCIILGLRLQKLFWLFQPYVTSSKELKFHYTLYLKTIHLTFDHNFGKCRLIFKILSLTDSQGNSLCNYCRAFHLTSTVLLHYLVKLTDCILTVCLSVCPVRRLESSGKFKADVNSGNFTPNLQTSFVIKRSKVKLTRPHFVHTKCAINSEAKAIWTSNLAKSTSNAESN